MSAIEQAVALTAHLADQLRYLQPTTAELLRSASGRVPAQYLEPCRALLREGKPFPQAWRTALRQSPGALKKADVELLLPLGETLGSTAMESQLSALEYTREKLEHTLLLARRDREKYHRLYGTLGALAGVMAAILIL